MRRSAGRTAALAALAALSLGTGIASAFPAAAGSSPATGASAAPAQRALDPPTAVHDGRRLLVARSPGATPAPTAGLSAFAVTPGAPVPAAVDLSRNVVPVADQGAVGSCAAWAIGYGMLGWYARSSGHGGAPFAPMYVYSQVDGGGDEGSSPADVLEVLRTQGIDTAAHYGLRHARAAFDWAHAPSAAERSSAAANRIAGWVTIYNTVGPVGTTGIPALKQALASGRPVALTIGVDQRFLDAAGPHGLVSSAGSPGPLLGYHEVLAVGYDSRGVRIQNSWGTGWGEGGFATLDWGYVSRFSYEAETANGFLTTTAANRPVVTRVSAVAGSRSGGQVVTVTGARLAGALLSVGPRTVAALTVSTDGRTATFRIPAGSAGSATLRLATPTGIATTGPQTYRYL